MFEKKPRIRVTETVDIVRIAIKAEVFSFGNVVLTIGFLLAVMVNVFVGYFIFMKAVNLAYSLPLFVLSFLPAAFLIRAWLWHFFGEELIEISCNYAGTRNTGIAYTKPNYSLYLKRGYGIFTSSEKHIELNGLANMRINKTDTWCWRECRGKGIFRISSQNGEYDNTLDFGIKLNDQDYALVLSHFNNILGQPREANTQSASGTDIPAETLHEAGQAELQPSLEEQMNGKLEEKLEAFYDNQAKKTNDEQEIGTEDLQKKKESKSDKIK